MARVLVIDDEAPVRFVTRRMLESGGHEVLEAADGAEGLRCYRLQRPDVVITDILMPESEGLGTIRELLREFPNARIVAVTGGGETGRLDFLSHARDLGARCTLRKPFSPDEILTAVAEALHDDG